MIHVGCCGFQKARATYFQHFALVEVQRTFYKPPRVETARHWREEAPPGFTFTLKPGNSSPTPPPAPPTAKPG